MRSPMPGLSMRRTANGVPVIRMHYSADPALTPERLAELRTAYTSDAFWRQEMEIEYDALDGQRVYPEFSVDKHVVDDAEVPRRGCLYMSIDPHPRTPHAMLWVLIDAYSDWWVYRELWPSKWRGSPETPRDDVPDYEFTIREYCETLAYLEGNEIDWKHPCRDEEYGVYQRKPTGEHMVDRFMDQAGKGFKASAEGQRHETYATRYRDYGITCRDPIKSHKSGEDAIRDLLKSRRHEFKGDWPRLHIAASCRELILELLRHRYKRTRPSEDERDLRQDGIDARCHMIDNLRYLATARIGYIPRLASEVNDVSQK